MRRALALSTIGFLSLVAVATPVRESAAMAIGLFIVAAGLIEHYR